MRTYISIRLLAACAALLMAFGLLPGALAQGTEVLAPPEDGVPFCVVCAQGQTLYMLREDGLYQLHNDELTQLADFTAHGFDGQYGQLPYAAELVADPDGLYLLGGAAGPLWRFQLADARFEQLLPFNPDAADDLVYRGYFVQQGALYAVAVDAQSGVSRLMRTGLDRFSWQPVTGDTTLAAPWRDGQALVVRNVGGPGGGRVLGVLDTQSGRVEDKLPLSQDYRALRANPATDTLWLMRAGEMQASVGFGEPQTVLRLPADLEVRDAVVLADGRAAYARAGGVWLLAPGDAADVLPLRVLGQVWDLPTTAFAADNPDIAPLYRDNYPEDTAALTLHMMSGEGAADVYVIYSSQYNLDALFEKGWYYDLGQDDAVAQAVHSMYPYLQKALTRDGRVLAAPFTAHYSALALFTTAWAQMGLTEVDYPRDYGQLLDFIDRWHMELADQHPSISLFGADADARVYKMVLLNNMLSQWRLQQTAQGQPVRFKPLRGLIARLLQADFSRIGEGTVDYENIQPGMRVLYPGHDVYLGAALEATDFIALRVLPDTPAVTSADAMLLLVNPHTQNPEAALRFVRYMVEHIAPATAPLLYPGADEPLSAGMDFTVFEQNIAAMQASIAQTEGAEKRELEERLARMTQDLEQQKQHDWLVTPEGLKALHSLADAFQLRQANEYPGAGVGAQNNIHRLIDGQISLDQFISESDQAEKLREAEAGRD